MPQVKENLIELIKITYPELTDSDFGLRGSIEIRDDSDGSGSYVAKWEYSKPIPESLKLGK
jgi:hypothetical protein